MNPYDFVRVVWQQPSERHTAPPQDRFSGISGRLEGTITALTPFLIRDPRSSIRDPRSGIPQSFLCNAQQQPIIPGASLKGLFRSLVETVDGGAWWFFGGHNGAWTDKSVQGQRVNYADHLPVDFKRPSNLQQLDAACRMFGFLDGEKMLAGSVGFEDGVCVNPIKRDAFYTCILSSPKPRHRAWYLDDQQRLVRGRKFYFHSTKLQTASVWLPHKDALQNQRQHQYIKPLDAGSTFTFRAHFTSVSSKDLALLLYALALEPDMRHKAGYGKSAGLGSIEVKLNWLETVDYATRYQAGGGGIMRYEHDILKTYVDTAIQPFINDKTSITLQDLRRIWHWPAAYEQRYPTRNWFADNPNTPISETL